MIERKKVVIILSGGMDSATLLYHYLDEKANVHAISFNYGQRHSRELRCAEELCLLNKIPHQIVDLPITNLLQGSSQTDDRVDVPEGHYADENMKKTVVPNRNMIMLAVAGAYAIGIKADVLAYGAHAGDHTIYPDCRMTFTKPMREAFRNCDWHELELETPFILSTKGDIVRHGEKLGVPYEVTWTCYKGKQKHCGKCGACQERIEAFKQANAEDPVEYEGEIQNVGA